MPDSLYINGFAYLIGDAAAEDFAPFTEVRKLRRMEGICKNALLCAFRALEQAGADLAAPKENTGLSIAMGAGALESTCKFMDSIITDGDALSSPTAFAGSVHNSAGLALSMFLRIKGPCLITGQLDASFAGALLTARQLLAKKMCRDVLVAVAEDVNPLLPFVLTRYGADFAPFLYGHTQPFQRVAAALFVSAEPNARTQFAVRELTLARCADDKIQVPPAEFCSCAHSAVAFVRQLQARADFTFDTCFAGSSLHVEAKKYA